MAYVHACAVVDVPADEGLAITLGGVEIALARDGDTVYALEDLCSHAAVPLSEGEVENCHLECYLHGSRFDLRTGKPAGPPATEPVATYPVQIRAGEVFVDLP